MATKTRKQRTWKPFTESDYKILKELQNLGVDRTGMIKITGRGGATVHYAMKTNTFEEFQQLQRVQTERSHQRALEKKAQRETPVFDTVEQRLPLDTEEVTVEEATIVGELVKINANLERLAIAWETSPTETKRRGLLR